MSSSSPSLHSSSSSSSLSLLLPTLPSSLLLLFRANGPIQLAVAVSDHRLEAHWGVKLAFERLLKRLLVVIDNNTPPHSFATNALRHIVVTKQEQ
jgi:hypothetical protein